MKVRSDVNEEFIKKLIEDGDAKLANSKDALFSTPKSLIDDAIRSYKQAQSLLDPNNTDISDKIKTAETCRKDAKEKEAKEKEERAKHSSPNKP